MAGPRAGRRGRGLGRLGLRVRARLLRAALRGGGDHLRRAGQRDHPAAGRQGDGEADGREGRRAGRAVERWAGRRRRAGRRGRGAAGLPGRAQGDGWAAAAGASASSTQPADLAAAFTSARSEAELAFGDPAVFLEAFVPAARHVEVQVIADDYGTVWALGRPRLQHPAAQPEGDRGVVLDRARPARPRQEIRAAAVRLAAVAGYRNAGTVEFLVDPGDPAVPVHGGQHPVAGRAPGHRGHHRRWTWSSCSCTSPRGGRLDGKPAAGARARRRGPAVRRGPRAGLRARAWAARPAAPADRRRRTGRLRRTRGRRRLVGVRLADRQDHRLGRRPRRGPVPAAPGAGPEHRRRRGRDDQPVLPAHAARPAGGSRRPRRQPLAGPLHRRRRARARRRTRWRCWWRPSRPTTPTTADVQAAFHVGAARGRPEVPAEVGTRVQLRYCGVSLSPRRLPHLAGHLPCPARRDRRRPRGGAARRLRAPGRVRRPQLSRRSR